MEHARNAIEIRIERGARDALRPPRIVEDEIVGTNVNARVDEGSAAEPTRGDDAEAGEKTNVVEAGVGWLAPEQTRDVGRIARKLAIAIVSSALEHEHFFARFGESKRADRSAESSANDDGVV